VLQAFPGIGFARRPEPRTAMPKPKEGVRGVEGELQAACFSRPEWETRQVLVIPRQRRLRRWTLTLARDVIDRAGRSRRWRTTHNDCVELALGARGRQEQRKASTCKQLPRPASAGREKMKQKLPRLVPRGWQTGPQREGARQLPRSAGITSVSSAQGQKTQATGNLPKRAGPRKIAPNREMWGKLPGGALRPKSEWRTQQGNTAERNDVESDQQRQKELR